MFLSVYTVKRAFWPICNQARGNIISIRQFRKRELIGSMYAEKFTFEDLQHRTAKTSDLYSFIYLKRQGALLNNIVIMSKL
jgi:hypothetical protein